ncbi:DUF4383 domain-containing protein [Micromonospora sp. NPDC126480]|uniref:DUF4383 domain-containing protein n=1 Tax=Micromonospora sp. NPDC126480 TaxID=3155312 RepID=UPI00331CE7F8
MTVPPAHARARRDPADGQPPVRRAAFAVAVLFLIVGLLGFVPGVTSDFADLRSAGHQSGARLFGAFTVSVLHNLLHLLFGVVGLVAARRATAARAYLIGGGAIYLVLWLFGLAVAHDSAANFLPTNGGDDWLHLAFGAGMVALGVLTAGRARP